MLESHPERKNQWVWPPPPPLGSRNMFQFSLRRSVVHPTYLLSLFLHHLLFSPLSLPFLPTLLLLQTVAPGLLVLGAVHEITDLEVMVSLPHNMTGVVAISNVSDPVTEKVEAEVEEGDGKSEEEEVSGKGRHAVEAQCVCVCVCVCLPPGFFQPVPQSQSPVP